MSTAKTPLALVSTFSLSNSQSAKHTLRTNDSTSPSCPGKSLRCSWPTGIGINGCYEYEVIAGDSVQSPPLRLMILGTVTRHHPA